jgi:hypothetical protein
VSADITGIIKSTGVALEQEAFKQFGAAIEGVAGNTLKNIFNVPPQEPTGTGTNPTTQETGVWDTTRYAAALVRPDQVEFNPKLKFLFKVSFEFDNAMIDAARILGYDLNKIQQNVSFMIRHIDRPKFDYDYEEVNMYNFRTKVLKQIRHREVGFTLYDDVGNNVLSFINLYRKLQVPITRTNVDPSQKHEDFGFEFDKTMQGLDTGMRGALPGDRINILRKMTIHQIYVERGSTVGSPSAWVKTVDFVFMNPRFTNIDIDDMDHENGSNFNLVTLTADFDSMFMDEPKPFTQSMAPSFPSGDISADGNNGATDPAGGNRNPFIDIIANQTGRVVQQGVSNIINKTLGTTAGGNIVAGQLTSVGSLIGDAAKRTLGSFKGSQGFVTSRNPAVADDSVARSQIPNLSSQTSSDDINGFV